MLLHGGGLSWWNYRAEAELLGDRCHVVLPGSCLEIKDGLYHGDYSINHPERYVEELLQMISQ